MDKSFDFSAVLKNHEHKHKSKPTQFTSVAKGVERRLQANLKHSKGARLTVLDSGRDLSRGSSPAPVTKVQIKAEHRRKQLEKWKEDKERKKRELAAQKKKPFVAGVVHPSLVFVPPPPAKVVPSTSGRVTRSQVKSKVKSESKANGNNLKYTQSFAPQNAQFKPPQAKNLAKAPVLRPWVTEKKKTNDIIKFEPVISVKNVMQTRSKANKPNIQKTVYKPDNVHNNKTKVVEKTAHNLKSSSSSELDSMPTKSPAKKNRKSLKKEVLKKSPVPKSESSSEEKLRSPGSSVKLPVTPEQMSETLKVVSPFVTASRGKDNARREIKKKMEEGLLDEDASEMDSVQYFRQQLDSEIKRMTGMCEVWDKISEQTQLPETVQELVLGAVGQARLLMSAKLQQFARLVTRCQRPSPGSALVTPADLHGFWDMVYMQIENIDIRFKKLEELKARGWMDEPVQERVKPKGVAKKMPLKHTAKPSQLREMIAAARRAKKDHEDTNKMPLVSSNYTEDKTFEAGFFCVKSPVRSPAVDPPHKQSLLKSVLSNETRKSASKNASYAMLRASLMHKDIEIEGVELLQQTPEKSPVNLSATPGRSILKSNSQIANRSLKKIVYFDNSDVETQNKENVDEATKETKTNAKLERQDAVEERSPILTRSRRKSQKTPGSERGKKELRALCKEFEEVQVTPRRSSRKKTNAGYV